MPNAPSVACHCGVLNCQTHSAKAKAKQHDQWRGTAASRGYGRRWSDKLRPMVLRRDPLCSDPFHVGCIQRSTIADHVIPKQHGGPDALENLQGICDSCHNRKIRLEQLVTFVRSCECLITERVVISGSTIIVSCIDHAAEATLPLKSWCFEASRNVSVG